MAFWNHRVVCVAAVGTLLGVALGFGCSTVPTKASVVEETWEFVDSEQIPVGDSHTFGDPNAPVMIVEFFSMQCPFCSRANGILKQLVEDNPEDVQVVFKHFPLPFQAQAEPASRALEAAGQQGKFWEMQDLLFENLERFREGDFEDLAVELAGRLNLDVYQFRQDFHDPATAARVRADQELGQRLGVRGTPHFFVNGELVNGAQPLAHFQEVLDRQLAQIEELRDSGAAEGELYAAAVRANFNAPAQQPQAQQPPAQPRQPESPTEVHMVPVQDHDFARGASADEALVTILSFSSFQCPFSYRGAGTLGELVERYPNEVRVVFKHFPLSFQAHSEPASRASVAAGQQDMFWEYSDLLFQNQRRLSESGIYEELALELGLNMDRFRADFDSQETANRVSEAQREGQGAGVRGTPGYLINGIKIVGAQPLEVFEGHVVSQIEIARRIRDERHLRGEELYAAVVEDNIENLAAAAPAAAQPQAPREPTRVADDALTVGSSYTLGPDDAPVTIYVFSSFQCQFSARAARTLRQLIEEYPDEIRVVFKNFPHAFQELSEPMARAAMAAGEQGRFWEMHDALYENQHRFSDGKGPWENLAAELGLDMDQFRSDFASDAIAARVEAEAAEGRSVGVRGTPASFINGDYLGGAQPLARFKELIDRHLAE